MKRDTRSSFAAGLLLLFLAWLVLYPLLLVLIEGFRGPDGWTLDFVRQFFQRRNEAQALWGSLWISVATVVLAGGIGVPLAFLFWRYDFPGRRTLGGLVALAGGVAASGRRHRLSLPLRRKRLHVASGPVVVRPG